MDRQVQEFFELSQKLSTVIKDQADTQAKLRELTQKRAGIETRYYELSAALNERMPTDVDCIDVGEGFVLIRQGDYVRVDPVVECELLAEEYDEDDSLPVG